MVPDNLIKEVTYMSTMPLYPVGSRVAVKYATNCNITNRVVIVVLSAIDFFVSGTNNEVRGSRVA